MSSPPDDSKRTPSRAAKGEKRAPASPSASPSASPPASPSPSSSRPPSSGKRDLPPVTPRPPSDPITVRPGHPLWNLLRGPDLAKLPHSVLSNFPAAARPMPVLPREKCFTWCSQRSDASPFCRMLCFRKRQPGPDESLNPPRRSSSAPSPSSSQSIWPSSEEWKPFEGLRKWVEPYSFVYVRGTPDGVVGRYMEELGGDDGFHDFGTVSRGADEARRRKKEGEVYQSFDWGPDGSLKYLPITTLLHPLFILPLVAQRIFLGPQAFTTYARTHLLSPSPDGNLVLQLWDQIHTGNVKKTAETMWEKRLKIKIEYVDKDEKGASGPGPGPGQDRDRAGGAEGSTHREANQEVKKAIQREMDGGAGKKGPEGGEGRDGQSSG